MLALGRVRSARPCDAQAPTHARAPKDRDDVSRSFWTKKTDGTLPDVLDVQVDEDRCVGHGSCIEFAPGVFERNARNQAEATDALGGSREEILEAAANCPALAVILRDPDTGETVDV